ncbi:MAG: hypothetical protein SPD47_04055 [Oscillospiraceae bacterium]|nr:hypothetical protein [Oscillospiraceae bacterium]
MRKYVLAAMTAAAAVGILLRPGELSGAVGDAVAACLEVLIPALFAFTVLAVYLQQSGLYMTALAPLTKPLSLLLGIPGELCAVFLLANIGGYPVGARLLAQLVRSGRLSRRDAGRMLCCCYGSGPSFVIGTAGTVVFGSAAVGGVIYAACFLSSLIIAIFVCRTGERITLSGGEVRVDLTAECFVRSVDSGARVMYTVCIMSVAFSALTALLESVGVNRLTAELLDAAGCGGNSSRILPALLDVTRVREMIPSGEFAVPLCAGLLSFGGVCVIIQVLAVSGGSVPVRGLLVSRLPAAVLSAVLSLPAGLMADASAAVYAANTGTAELFSVNAGLSVCVMAMAGMLILSFGKQRDES